MDMLATGFDILGFILVGVFALTGFKQGLVQGLAKLVGAGVAMYATMNHSDVAISFLAPLIDIPAQFQSMVGFVVTFIVVLQFFNLIAWVIKRIFASLNLGMVDHIGGLAFGIAKAGLIMSAFIWGFMLVPDDIAGNWQKDSQLYPYVDIFQGYVVSLFGFEDELLMLQETVDGIIGGGMSGGIDINSPLFQKALKALGPEQQKLVNEMIKLQSGEGGDPTQILQIINDLGGAKNPAFQQAMQMMPEEQQGQMQELLEGLGEEGMLLE